MTVSSSTSRVSYSGNGTLTAFAYTFKIFDEGDLTVILRASDGTETVQTITTHYTVSGVGDAGGGNVTFVTAPTATQTVVILREQPLTQGLDLVPNDPFPANSLEEALDKIVFMTQKHEEELGRAIKASRTNTITGSEFTISAANRANKVFAFDSSGDVSITSELGVYRGNWAASVAYNQRDIVKDTSNNNIYLANTAHTSSGSTPLSSNADIAKWDLLVDAAAASTSASAAATSATAAQTAQTAAETAQTAAETAQTAAETAETNAETAQTAAETAQTAAETAQTAAETAYDNFDDRYLGAKSSDPTVDNDGDALIDGALYFDTTNNVMKVYDLGGTAWNRTTPTSAEQTNIDTVSGISANVTTVAGISGNVTTVAGISSDVTTVAADGTDIGTVAGISANVTTVAGVASDVTTVAGISSDVTTVAADGTDIGTVASISSNVTTVAGVSSDVTTVAGISANVTTVAGISANVTTVAGDTANIGTIATNLNGTDTIGTVAGSISNVNSVGGSIANVNTVATNLASVNSFANTYRIGATDPTTSLDTGDLFYNTSSSVLKVYNGSAWEAGVTAGSGFLALTGGTLTGGLTGTTATFSGDLTVDTNTLYVDSTNNNVSIATTTPAAKLDISYGAASNEPAFLIGADSAGFGLTTRTNNTEKFGVIGGVPYTTSDGYFNVLGSFSNSSANGVILGGGTSGLKGATNIRFNTSTNKTSTSTERMRIDSSGNLLVGTTSGSSPITLQTRSGEFYQTGMQINSTNSDFSGAVLDVRATSGSINTTNGRFLRFYSDNGTTERFHVTGGGTVYAAGNLGVGTSSPSSFASTTLEISGSSTASDLKLTNTTTGTGNASGFDLELNGSDINYVNRTASGNQKFWTNSTERMRIDSSGKVGIGTSSPAEILHIKSSSGNAMARLQSGGASSRTQVQGYDNSGNANYVLGSNDNTNTEFWNYKNGYMRFATNSTERFRIGTSGELGIGGATYGTSGQVLTSSGSGSAPTWADVSGGMPIHTANGTSVGVGEAFLITSTSALPSTWSWTGSQLEIAAYGGTWIGWIQPSTYNTSFRLAQMYHSNTAGGGSAVVQRVFFNSSTISTNVNIYDYLPLLTIRIA